MRKLLAGIGVLIVLIIVALLLAPKLINVEKYRGKIQAELQQRLNRPISFGAMGLSLLPIKIEVNNATIGEDPHFGSGQFATVQRLDVHAKLLPLIHGDVEVSSVVLNKPHIELIRNAQGVWNFSSIGPQQKQAQAQPSGGQKNFALDHLQISDGAVALTDQQKHQSRAVYDHIDVDLKDFAPDKQFN